MHDSQAARRFLADEQARSLLRASDAQRAVSVTVLDPGTPRMVYDAAVLDYANQGIWLAATPGPTSEEEPWTLLEFDSALDAFAAFAAQAEEMADRVERNQIGQYSDIIGPYLRYRAAVARADSARAVLGNAIRRNGARIRAERAMSSVAHAIGISREFLYRVLAMDEWTPKEGGGPPGVHNESNEKSAKTSSLLKSKTTARFVVEAIGEEGARAVIARVLDVIDVVVSSEPVIAQTRQSTWTVEFEIDLSGLNVIHPDDAVTRITYVTRNLIKVTWQGQVRPGERRGRLEWFGGIPGRDEVLAHPAIRAATIEVSSETGAGDDVRKPHSVGP